ncbi:MAG: hypothetical protein IJF92_05865 [Bacilli bacterium]|nr:hypothetical protein [Bacilli bacterium]
MDDIIKQCIDGRMSVFNAYNPTDEKILKKIEDLSKKMNEFGEGCKDAMEFNDKFMKSPLNEEYNNLIVEVAKGEVEISKPSIGEAVADRVGTSIRNEVMPSRAVRADKRDQMIRDIPVVGDVMQGKQTFDLFKRFKKDK